MRHFAIIFLVATLAQAQPFTVLWDRSGVGEHSHFGTGVSSLGDQNEDGFDDWAVLSAGRASPGQENESRFDLFHGGNPPSTVPYMTFVGRVSPRRDFLEARVIGDVNGDGFQDWWTWNLVPGDSVVRVEVFFGGPAADTVADAFFRFPATGWDWMTPVGDVNGDGCDDFCFYNGGGVGLPLDRTFFFLGGNPLDTIPDMVIHSNPRGSQSALPVAYGDVNGDGYGDFETTSNIEAVTYVYHGSANPDTIPDQILPGVGGFTMAILPDINGDGRDDLVNSGCPDFRVHLGSNTISLTPNFALHFPDCNGSQDLFATTWDYNRDGLNDLVAIDRTIPLSWGTLRLYLGYHWLNPDAVLAIEGREPPLNLVGITTAAGLGDVNGDGVDDLAIGATNDNWDGQRGRVVILSGDTTLRVGVDDFRPEIPRELSVSVFPNPFNPSTTIRFDLQRGGRTRLAIYNLLGQEVAVLRDGMIASGSHVVLWEGTDARGLFVGTGIYFARLEAPDGISVIKLALIR